MAVRLWILCAVIASASANAPEVGPEALELSGNGHFGIPAFGGFPQSSWTMLMTVQTRSAATSDKIRGGVGQNKGTFMSFYSQDKRRSTFSVYNPSNLAIRYGHQGKSKIASSGLSIADGSWHSLAFVFDYKTNKISVYVDQVKGAELTLSGFRPGEGGVCFPGSGTMRFGQEQTCATGCFVANGGLVARVKHVSMLDMAISPAQIKDYMTKEGTKLSSEELGSRSVVFAYPLVGAGSGSGTVATDMGPHHLNAELGIVGIVPSASTAAWAQGHEVLHFDGTGHLEATFDRDFPAYGFTASMWVFSQPQSAAAALLSYASASEDQMVAIRNPERLEVVLMGSVFKTTLAIPANAWTYIAVSVDCKGEGGSARSLTVYVGTEEHYTVALPDLRFDRSGTFVVGQLQTCANGCFDQRSGFQGFIEGVRFWNETLDSDQIAADRNRAITTLSAASDGMGSSPTDMGLIVAWTTAARDSSTGAVADASPGHHDARGGGLSWSVSCPSNCSYPAGGQCDDVTGLCKCKSGFSGDSCSEGCLNGCSGRGTCLDGKCQCFPMYSGEDCSVSTYLTLTPYMLCERFPESISPKDMFCDMLDFEGKYPSNVVEPHMVLHYDAAARQAFAKVAASSCPNGKYGRRLLHSSICARFFPMCNKFGEPMKPCKSDCEQFTTACGMGGELCDEEMFGAKYAGSRRSCYTPPPIDRPEDCPNRCRGHGACRAGKCLCEEPWVGDDCGRWEGDPGTSFAERKQDFCVMVDYSVPHLINTTWADRAAREAYNMLEPFCESTAAKQRLKQTMCATSHLQLNPTNGEIKKPCRSMCQSYGALCGIAHDSTCFGGFYDDPPNCFVFQTEEEKRAEQVAAFARACGHGPCVHGHCQMGTCVCNSSWYGPQCNTSLPTCADYCSNHGVCQDGICKCLPGWGGQGCTERLANVSCDQVCVRAGGRPEACCRRTVMEAFDAFDFSVLSSYKSTECANGCSGHGSCGLPATHCRCEPGWHGADCASGEGRAWGCFGGCGGNGECLTTSGGKEYCSCKMGYTGPACSQELACPEDCNANGICVRGKCKCYGGFGGAACGYELPKCPHQLTCINGGMCIKKNCVCPAGFEGVDCGKRLRCDEDFTCKNGGVCGQDGVCECDWARWQGFDCTQRAEHMAVGVQR